MHKVATLLVFNNLFNNYSINTRWIWVFQADTVFIVDPRPT